MTAPIKHTDFRLEPYTFEDFLRFCDSRPPETRYDYESITHCACAQYSKEIGGTWHDEETEEQSFFWDVVNSLAAGRYHPSDWNFGELALRVYRYINGVAR